MGGSSAQAGQVLVDLTLVWWIGLAVVIVVLVSVILYKINSRGGARSIGMANRDRFVTLLDRRVKPSAIAVFDIEEFRAINEVLGHAGGDRVLAGVAERLDRAIRETDVVGHLGADRFAVHLADIDDDAVAADVVGRLLTSLTAPLDVDGIDVDVAASVGVAVVEVGLGGRVALQRATAAVEAAKSRSTTVEMFRPEHEAHTEASLAVVGQVRRGLVGGEFEPYYQPVVSTSTGRTIGFEALVRWHHKDRGLIPPALFLHQIENLPVGRELTDHLLDTSLAGLRRLAQLNVFLSFNLSVRDVEAPALPATVAALLERHEIAAERLTFEVNERVGTRRRERARLVLQQLGDLGCGIAIDDFGSTALPIDFLATIPVTELKIDPRFVAGVTADPIARAAVRYCVGLGHGAGLRVTAKGVERAAVLDEVVDLGCDAAQGFHFAEPMPVADLVAWMANERSYR